MKNKKKIQIDGSHGEGGGQMVRTALTLSSLLKIPVHIKHIRSNRKKPGLRPQHLAAVNILVTITGGEAEGAQVDSQELIFKPGEITSRKLSPSNRYCRFNKFGNTNDYSCLSFWKSLL